MTSTPMSAASRPRGIRLLICAIAAAIAWPLTLTAQRDAVVGQGVSKPVSVTLMVTVPRRSVGAVTSMIVSAPSEMPDITTESRVAHAGADRGEAAALRGRKNHNVTGSRDPASGLRADVTSRGAGEADKDTSFLAVSTASLDRASLDGKHRTRIVWSWRASEDGGLSAHRAEKTGVALAIRGSDGKWIDWAPETPTVLTVDAASMGDAATRDHSIVGIRLIGAPAEVAAFRAQFNMRVEQSREDLMRVFVLSGTIDSAGLHGTLRDRSE